MNINSHSKCNGITKTDVTGIFKNNAQILIWVFKKMKDLLQY